MSRLQNLAVDIALRRDEDFISAMRRAMKAERAFLLAKGIDPVDAEVMATALVAHALGAAKALEAGAVADATFALAAAGFSTN